MPTATKSVPDTVLDVLSRSTTDGNRLVLPGTLDRADYLTVDKVLKAVGGKWNRSAKAHLFAGDAADAIEPVLLTGTVTDQRRAFDAFYTPSEIARQVIDQANIKAGHDVLEPSAGDGALALPAAETGAYVWTYERRDHVFPADPVIAPRICQRPGVDFLTVEPGEERHLPDRTVTDYDRVVMNPPFSNQADMRHVRHAARFVRSGGRLVAIMSPAFTFRTTPIARDFRAWLDGHPHGMVELPDGSFKASGTGVRTVLLVVDL